jgi:hypothetical protein
MTASWTHADPDPPLQQTRGYATRAELPEVLRSFKTKRIPGNDGLNKRTF